MTRFKGFLHLLLIGLIVFCPLSPRAQLAPGDVIIRDAEIEDTLKEWIKPILKAANLDPAAVHIILVQSRAINAFVAGGQNIFIYTGLIEKTDNPLELIGVMAHEMGHIAGGHLVATRSAMERASYESILGAFLGIGTAIATGQGGAAQAIIAGSNSMAMRRFFSHSRVQESSADQAGLRFMEAAQISPKGLISFFGKLESEELMPLDQQSEYMRTHPLTRDRIEAVSTTAQKSPYFSAPVPEHWTEQHARMKAKLISFIDPGRIAWVYNDSDTSVPAEYARAIADYRNTNVDKALKEIDGLIARESENPYFQELKGQMLVDFGRVAEAVPYYKKASAALPDSGLIRIALAHAQLESGGGSAQQKEAIENLERALRDEPRSARAYRLLATAYGTMGNETMAKLNLAEEAVLQGRYEYAKSQAEAVIAASQQGSREWLRAKDISAYTDQAKNKAD